MEEIYKEITISLDKHKHNEFSISDLIYAAIPETSYELIFRASKNGRIAIKFKNGKLDRLCDISANISLKLIDSIFYNNLIGLYKIQYNLV